jgi:glutathione S-transferase
MLTLAIGNKAYSSWSLRPWILLSEFGVAFAEDFIPLDTPEFKARVAAYGAGKTVPILKDGDVVVWESLAIMDYVAELFPDKAIWPRDKAARAYARAIAAEMHSGFGALRKACPMNIRKRFAAKDRGEAVAQDVARIEHLWGHARRNFGVGGPFLFGAFSAADAMYAPVVTRFETYSIPVSASARAYMDAVLATASFRRWHDAAMAEPFIVAADEPDEPAVGSFPLPPSISV